MAEQGLTQSSVQAGFNLNSELNLPIKTTNIHPIFFLLKKSTKRCFINNAMLNIFLKTKIN